MSAPTIVLIDGLWRKPVKGFRGATPKPGSMTEYIRQKRLLPAEQIDALWAATPTHHLSAADFERDGVKDWSEWVDRLIIASRQSAPVST